MELAPDADAVVFRRLGPADAADCVPLSAAAGWGHTADEWRGRLTFGVGFGAEADGRLVAAGVLLPGSSSTAYFGLLLTLPAWRGRGLGADITQMALDEARQHGVRQVALFAVPKAAPIYARLGFADMALALDSFWREGLGHTGAMDTNAEGVRPLVFGERHAAFALDAEAYGGARGAALAAQVEREPSRAFAVGPPGAPSAFGLATMRAGHLLIGPIVASDAAAALALVDRLCASPAPAARLDSLALPDAERSAFRSGLLARGFAMRLAIPLMIWGRDPAGPFAHPERLFAAQSAATG